MTNKCIINNKKILQIIIISVLCITNLEVERCPLKKNLFEPSVLLMNAMYNVCPEGNLYIHGMIVGSGLNFLNLSLN